MKLTAISVERMRPDPDRRVEVPDAALPGLYVVVQQSGIKSWALRYRAAGKSRKLTLGRWPALGLAEAREAARTALRAIEAGADPAAEKVEAKATSAPAPSTTTFAAISSNYVRRHVDGRGLRSVKELRRILAKYVLPAWGEREFADIRRGDVAELLDHVQDKHGPRQADLVLAVVRGCMNWHATRSDDYVVPIAKGMRRHLKPPRSRILNDDEIRIVWRVAEAAGTFGDIVRLCLLTAQRREKVATMRWSDLDLDAGVWSIPTSAREKGNAGVLELPEAALAIIRARPVIVGNPHVFPGRKDRHFVGWSTCKRRVDAAVAEANGEGLSPWTVHDMRRSARSLMSRSGVRPDIAERVLGHVISGVEGIYDRHAYQDEKAEALRRLAALMETIVNPPAGANVVAISDRRGVT